MLLDEPFSGLDTRLREQIRDDALHVLKSSGTATLMVTHDPEEAMFMADRLAIMRAGRIEQQGSPVEVYAQPATAFVAVVLRPGQRAARDRCASGAVITPLGALAAPGFADGTAVEVLIRPEALQLSPADVRHPIAARVHGGAPARAQFVDPSQPGRARGRRLRRARARARPAISISTPGCPAASCRARARSSRSGSNPPRPLFFLPGYLAK